MTSKEKQIVKQLSYTSFILYYYIKHHKTFSNKEMEFELGLSKESRFRSLKALRKANIINVTGHSYNRIFTVMDEKEWKL